MENRQTELDDEDDASAASTLVDEARNSKSRWIPPHLRNQPMPSVSRGRMSGASIDTSMPRVEEQVVRRWNELATSSAAEHDPSSTATIAQTANERPTEPVLQAMRDSMATTTLDIGAYAVVEQDSVGRSALGSHNTFGGAAAGSHDSEDDGTSSESNHPYVIDTIGENPKARKLPPPIVIGRPQNRSISPAPSSPNSSEEEILFHGRRNLTRVVADSTISRSSTSERPADAFVPAASEIYTAMSPTENHPVAPIASGPHSSVLAMNEPITPMTGITTSVLRLNAVTTRAASEHTSTETESWDRSDKLNPPWVHRSKPGIGWLPQPKKPKPQRNVIGLLSSEEQDAVMRDFYENLRQQELTGEIDMMADAQRLTCRDLSQPNDPPLPDAAETSSDVASQTGPPTRQDLPPPNRNTPLSDGAVQPASEPSFASSSLSSSELGSFDDDDDDDTEDGRVSSTGAVYGDEIDGGGSVGDEEDETNSDTAEDLEEDNREKQEAEDRRMARRIERQEKRLRRLSQSLSLDGAADCESSDDEEYDDDATYDELAVSEATIMHEALEYAKTKPKKSGRARQSFPAASALATALEQDPYDGFDVMDFDRPSLRRKGKARFELELSDEALEQQLHTAWEKDRQAKKARKQRREEMRAQGLVGGSKRKKAGPRMLVETDGVSLADLKQMIRSFLDDSTLDTQDLPPMAKGKRLAVHRIAHSFGIKSDSRNSEPHRHIVFTKTNTTKAFNSQTFKRASRKVTWAFPSSRDSASASNAPSKQRSASDTKSPNKRKSASGTNAPSKRRGQGGFTYRDGEIVGAGAEEIGADNRGRAMLEKMGWSSGMALGAGDNKGILEPIAHVVKNSRLGLG